MNRRLSVYAIHTFPGYPPFALGMCLALARATLDPRDVEVATTFIGDEAGLVALAQRRDDARHVFLFSDYVWSAGNNLRLSAVAKALMPDCVTIHGGHQVPSRPEECAAFLARNPCVDYAVFEEGETPLVALLSALLEGGAVSTIPGIGFLSNGELIYNTPSFPKDINQLPSPYLSGVFDEMDITLWDAAVIESTRGCPYGCAFCDWGSGISKLRSFDVERTVAEINWLADRKVKTIWFADGNFGLTKKDRAITEALVEAKRRTGYPGNAVITFAKNVKENLIDIVEMLVSAKLLAQGTISLQTSDPTTLKAINRDNIKEEKFEELRGKFVQRGLLLTVELMVGLPGATISSLKADLGKHFDARAEVFLHRTTLLINSPMADPEYIKKYAIEVYDDGRIRSTSTLSEAQVEYCLTLARLFQGPHRYGIFRYILRWLQWEKSIPPLDVLDRLLSDPQLADWPLLAAFCDDAHSRVGGITDLINTLTQVREAFRRDLSWDAAGRQLADWIAQRFDCLVPESLLIAQSALMPADGKRFPATIQLEHDIVAWYRDGIAGETRPLVDYPSGSLTITDPGNLSNRVYHYPMPDVSSYSWELESGLSALRTPNPNAESAAPRLPPHHGLASRSAVRWKNHVAGAKAP